MKKTKSVPQLRRYKWKADTETGYEGIAHTQFLPMISNEIKVKVYELFSSQFKQKPNGTNMACVLYDLAKIGLELAKNTSEAEGQAFDLSIIEKEPIEKGSITATAVRLEKSWVADEFNEYHFRLEKQAKQMGIVENRSPNKSPRTTPPRPVKFHVIKGSAAYRKADVLICLIELALKQYQ